MSQQQNRLAGDQYVEWYVKGPKSIYAYINTIKDPMLKETVTASDEGMQLNHGNYTWVKTGQIVKRYNHGEYIPTATGSSFGSGGGNKSWTPKPKPPAVQYEITDIIVEKLRDIDKNRLSHFAAGYSPAMTERGWLQVETNDANEKIVFFIKKKRVEYQ